MFKQPE